jgi:RNA polymerase sigma-70 factor (ECF subfamily)
MAFTEVDEKLLVRAYQAGDERAFDTIVRTQYNALYAHALRRLSQHEAAEDAVQDTLVRAYRALPKLDGDLALRAWLHRILTNVCHDEGSRRRRQQGLVEKVGALPEELAEDPSEEALLHDTVRVMSEALQGLPETYREALVLRYVDGLSFREVAEATGTTEENARARAHRGRVALHKILARLTVMLAFLIPGLRRTHAAAVAPTDQAATSGISDHTVNLATQLTSHAMTAAPTMSRFAEAAAALPGGKSTLAAAAMTAVAAVSVPVAVHTVHDASKTERPPVAAALPFEAERERATAVSTTTTVVATTTSSTLPQSQLHPFEVGPTELTSPTSTPHKSESTTSTTVTTTPAESGTTVEGHIGSEDVTITGEAPQWDVSGPISIVVAGKTSTGTIAARVFVYDDGSAESDDSVITVGSKTFDLRFRGTVAEVQDGVRRIAGKFVLTGGADLGLPDRGDVTVHFGTHANGTSQLTFDLRGRSRS